MKEKKNIEELYILPFDHRSSFYSNLFGFELPLRKKETALVKQYKIIVFRGFLKVYKEFVHKERLGILVDEEFGSEIIRTAKKMGINLCVSTEKSGKKILEFEYGNDLKKHLERIRPMFAKVLVRYNPANKNDNLVQLKRLKELSDFCKKSGIMMMIEPLVIPTEAQLAQFKGDKKKFDLQKRPKLMLEMINEMHKVGIAPDIWKVEAVEKKADWENIIKAVKSKAHEDEKVIVLGRGESKQKVNEWLKLAAHFHDIIGFAVGRTVFFKPLMDHKNKKMTKKETIDMIADNYWKLIRLWMRNRK